MLLFAIATLNDFDVLICVVSTYPISRTLTKAYNICRKLLRIDCFCEVSPRINDTIRKVKRDY